MKFVLHHIKLIQLYSFNNTNTLMVLMNEYNDISEFIIFFIVNKFYERVCGLIDTLFHMFSGMQLLGHCLE